MRARIICITNLTLILEPIWQWELHGAQEKRQTDTFGHYWFVSFMHVVHASSQVTCQRSSHLNLCINFYHEIIGCFPLQKVTEVKIKLDSPILFYLSLIYTGLMKTLMLLTISMHLPYWHSWTWLNGPWFIYIHSASNSLGCDEINIAREVNAANRRSVYWQINLVVIQYSSKCPNIIRKPSRVQL